MLVGTVLAATAWLRISAGTALAHTGEDADAGHVVVEFGLWALGATAVIVLAGLVFWIRAQIRRGSTS